jgi:glycolate oxidase subunit GlcD
LDTLIEQLRAVVGDTAVLSEPDELLVYECDGLPQHKYRPRAVVFPASTEQTSAVMRVLAAAGVPFTPRGAGTGLSGGALALNQGVVIELARLRKVLKIEANRSAVVQPGVVNSHVSRAVAHLGLHYVPDPSSQPTCTIGGNIAESAGGIHCLKYGTTTDHVLGVRVVLAGGEVVDLGGAGAETTGYDLLGVFVGSEGTFGIVTEATLRLVPIPPAVRTLLAEFAEVNDASHAVSAIIAAGVMPAALEMMDHEIIRAVEASVFAAGLPIDAGAALLIELDGLEAGIDEEAEHVKRICMQHGARDCRLARDDNERKKLWAARKGAFGAIGRIAPDSMIQDAVVPRSRLPEVLDSVFRIAEKYQLRIANVFHAGDGNLHPLICFDSRSAAEVRRVKEAGRELMETCVRADGSITGEHGVGFDKRELLGLIFSEADLEIMLRVRAAFDPTGLCNPGKIIPMLRGCGEARAQAGSQVPSPMSNVQSSSGVQSPSNLQSLTSNVQSSSDVQGSSSVQSLMSNVAAEPSAPSPPTSDLLGPRAPRPHRSPLSSLPSFDSDRARQQLSQLLGKENIAAAPQLPFSPSALVATPGSIAELCELMKLASSERWSVFPAGGMSWLDAGAAAKQTHLIVSTQRLNRIIEHEPADLIAVTEAGVTLSDFNRRLAANGQWLPLDPPDDGRATIGGVVATGLGGAHQFGYGAPRRHVIGMKVVLADGRLIKVGGRVVKNVAGYDLCKLFTGSYGTLGMIAEINFKLRPLPFAARTTMARGNQTDLLTAAQQVIDSRLFPVAVEIVSPQFACEAGWSEGKDHLLLMRFAGSLSAVNEQARATGELLEKFGVKSEAAGGADNTTEDKTIWETLAAQPSRFQGDFDTDIIWRVGLRSEDVSKFLVRLTQENRSSAESIWQASIGDGRIRVFDRLPHSENGAGEIEANTIRHFESLGDFGKDLGATLIIERAPAAIRNCAIDSGRSGAAAVIMERIKQQLDPDGIFPTLSAY